MYTLSSVLWLNHELEKNQIILIRKNYLLSKFSRYLLLSYYLILYKNI